MTVIELSDEKAAALAAKAAAQGLSLQEWLEKLADKPPQRDSSDELGNGAFFANLSIEELAVAQNVKPVKSPSDLASAIGDEEDAEAMIEEIYSSRK